MEQESASVPEPRYILRSSGQFGMAIALGAFALLLCLTQIIDGGWNGMTSTVVFALGIVLLGIAVFVLPSMEVNPDGVVVANTFSTIEIPLSKIAAIESRWGLRLTTTKGKTYGVRSFGASGSSRGQWRPDRTTSPSPGRDSAIGTYSAGHRIPIVTEGIMKLRATTYTAAMLIDEMQAEFPARKNPRRQELVLRQTIAADRVGLIVIGLGCLVYTLATMG